LAPPVLHNAQTFDVRRGGTTQTYHLFKLDVIVVVKHFDSFANWLNIHSALNSPVGKSWLLRRLKVPISFSNTSQFGL
jgi:hypothetical protein